MSKGRSKFAHHNGDYDAQFDAFLKESISSEESSLDTGRISKYLDSGRKKKKNSLWMIEDDEEDESEEIGLTGTGNRFMKKPQPAARKQPPAQLHRDSLDDESLRSLGKGKTMETNQSGVPTLNFGGSSLSLTETTTANDKQSRNPISLKVGKDTLDELADKERFFKEIEKHSDSTIDYSKLNHELDREGTMAYEGTLENTSGSNHDSGLFRDSNGNLRRSGEDHDGMLAKVALMDSLDSTIGSKPRASRDVDREMNTIHEGDAKENEGYDEPDAMIFDPAEDGRKTDTEPTQGVTLKTGTVFGYTNTSRDMEAIHNIYKKQVGMGTIEGEDYTLKDSSTMGGKSSMFATQKTDGVSGDTGSTPAFGLNPVVPNHKTDQRSVDDILREAKEYKPMGKYSTRPSVHFKDDMESRGFDDKTSEPSAALDLSPIVKSRSRDHSMDYSGHEQHQISSTQGFDASEQQESTPITANRSEKKTPQRDPFSHVKSSGYGRKSSNQLWSPADLQRHRPKDGEVKPPLNNTSPSRNKTSTSSRRTGKDLRRKDGSVDVAQGSALLESVQSFTDYLQQHFVKAGLSTSGAMKGAGLLSGAMMQNSNSFASTGVPEVQWSQEGPVLSSSQKVAVLEREQHMLREVRDWQEALREEKKIQAKLKVELDARDREYHRTVEQLKVDHEQEIFKLKQENYVMAAKITEDIDVERRPLVNGGLEDNTAVNEQVKLMEREIKEQEKLLAGYQQENERIYQEMKKLQTVSKTTEEKMFKENQRLQNEVVSLRDHLNRKELELKNKGLITSPAVQQQIAAGMIEPGTTAVLGAGRIAHLEAGLKDGQKREDSLLQEIEAYRHGKHELESQLDHMMGEMRLLEGRVNDAKQFQTKKDQEKHGEYEKEMERLNKKLRWYGENQTLLDKDAQIIKQKDAEIKQLKTKLHEVQSESGRKAAEVRNKAKERATEAKRTQDLERQVKEMENIIRKRHPNSLPVLMWAASNAPDPESGNKSSTTQFLENRIKKLVTELEEKDEGEKRTLRGLEQKYNAVKFQYEERIEELETRLSKYERPGDHNLKEGERPHSHAGALQKELDSCRDRHKKEMGDIKAENDKLKKELQTLKSKESAATKADVRNAQDKESELELRVKALQIEHNKQEKDKQALLLQVDRLQKEKQQVVMDTVRTAGRLAKTANEKLEPKRGRSSRPKSAGAVRTQRSHSSEAPALTLSVFTENITRDKYEPESFAGQHVSELLTENEHLKQKCSELQLESSHTRVTVNKVYAEAESRERRLREEYDDRLHLLKESHQKEIQRILTEHAMENSTSRLAHMTGRVDTQEVMVRHLKDQLSQSKVDGEELATLKIRETSLETQVRGLLDELHDAKKNHTPEMRHYESLQTKIVQLESRHAQREQELKQIIHQTRLNAHADLNEEIDKWKTLVEAKNKETETFRTELDSILGVLRELQRQGVLLPFKGLNNHAR